MPIYQVQPDLRNAPVPIRVVDPFAMAAIAPSLLVSALAAMFAACASGRFGRSGEVHSTGLIVTWKHRLPEPCTCTFGTCFEMLKAG